MSDLASSYSSDWEILRNLNAIQLPAKIFKFSSAENMLQILWVEREEQVRKPDLRSTSKKEGGDGMGRARFIFGKLPWIALRGEKRKGGRRGRIKKPRSQWTLTILFSGAILFRPSIFLLHSLVLDCNLAFNYFVFFSIFVLVQQKVDAESKNIALCCCILFPIVVEREALNRLGYPYVHLIVLNTLIEQDNMVACTLYSKIEAADLFGRYNVFLSVLCCELSKKGKSKEDVFLYCHVLLTYNVRLTQKNVWTSEGAGPRRDSGEKRARLNKFIYSI